MLARIETSRTLKVWRRAVEREVERAGRGGEGGEGERMERGRRAEGCKWL
jgi:hypothetical protein